MAAEEYYFYIQIQNQTANGNNPAGGNLTLNSVTGIDGSPPFTVTPTIPGNNEETQAVEIWLPDYTNKLAATINYNLPNDSLLTIVYNFNYIEQPDNFYATVSGTNSSNYAASTQKMEQTPNDESVTYVVSVTASN